MSSGAFWIFLISSFTLLQVLTVSSCVRVTDVTERNVGNPVTPAEVSGPQGSQASTARPSITEAVPTRSSSDNPPPVTGTTTERIPPAQAPPVSEIIPERSPLAGALLREQPVGAQEAHLATGDYRIGEEDELAISVYGDPDLAKTQTVRPGGKISFPLIGDITASGRTPSELRDEMAQQLARYVKQPNVTVIITKYNSRKISVLGEVRTPGLLRVSSDITLLEAISRSGGLTEDADLQGSLLIRDGHIQPVNFEKLFKQGDLSQDVLLRPSDAILIPNLKDKRVLVLGQVNKPVVLPLTPGITLLESISRSGGLTEDADLQGALLIRDGQIQPVNFEKLIKQGDFSQNLPLKPNDTVLIPNVRDKKVFVLGEVNKPGVLPLRAGVTLVESISMAGGFTENAKKQNVLIVRGGLGNPTMLTVNVDTITQKGQTVQNVPLEPGDIVYVPKSLVASVVKFFQNLASILTPLVLAESGIVLGPSMEAVLTGRATGGQAVSPQPVVSPQPAVTGR